VLVYADADADLYQEGEWQGCKRQASSLCDQALQGGAAISGQMFDQKIYGQNFI
jgi:hypothetical protein